MKTKFILFSLLIGSLFFLSACGQSSNSKQKVIFYKDDHKVVTIQTEVVDTPEKQTQGLMYRQELKDDEGMLFVFENTDIRSFWMKNMNFSIDIIYIDENFKVVSIIKEAPPCTHKPCGSYNSLQPAQYVVEVPAGFSDRYKIDNQSTFIKIK